MPAVVLGTSAISSAIGADQPRRRVARGLRPAATTRATGVALGDRLVAPGPHGRRRRGRERRHGRMIEIRPPLGDRHLGPQPLAGVSHG